jgi:cytoskeletal protein CcmA (bactofilin family)
MAGESSNPPAGDVRERTLKPAASAADALRVPPRAQGGPHGVRRQGSRVGGARPDPAAGPAPGGLGLTAFIDQGSEFEGKLSFKDTVRIDGHFRGEITSENTLVVGESGEIEAAIRSRTVVISGRVEGDIVATHELVLHKTAVVNGDVETPALNVETGAVLNGRVTMAAGEGRRPEPAPG